MVSTPPVRIRREDAELCVRSPCDVTVEDILCGNATQTKAKQARCACMCSCAVGAHDCLPAQNTYSMRLLHLPAPPCRTSVISEARTLPGANSMSWPACVG